ncbi:hypothetical protein [Acidovorax sp. Leaf160]|uniref:hypothetical protein n=1 Tax=Acidovorax sp. Leaf160 TaxID=1736280 RepID=UPI0006F91402|nr:hypothetical protein [Acidovorax sp. Leaf160]KQR53153.1 hypothetical protein ASF94_19710 [Acidovorax sp. Leaf160]
MKSLIASALMVLAPALALAQTADAAKAAAAKTTAKPAAKSAQPAAKKTTPAKSTAKSAAAEKTTVAKAKPKANSSRTQLKSATAQVASGLVAAEEALSPAELAIAEKVHTGRIACELGASVNIERDPASPGRFNLEGKGFKYRMTPVATSTGAVRLEDQHGGAVWLQIANKSMLMNQKAGQRLADECMSPEQLLVAEGLKTNPQPSVLDPLPAAAANK